MSAEQPSTMHGARTMKRTVSMLVVCALGLSIDIGAAHADEPPAAGGVFASEDLTASVVDEGWALSRIEGSYKLAAAIPGEIAVVTISSVPPAITRVDIETAEVTTGDPVVGNVKKLFVSPGGESAYALRTTQNGSFQTVTRVAQYSVADLTEVRTFDVPGSFHSAAVVPGDESLFVVQTTTAIHVVRDGVVLPSTRPTGPLTIGSLIAFDPNTIFGTNGAGIVELTIDGTGVASEATKVPAFVQPLRRVGDELLMGDVVYSVPSFAARPATPFDQAYQDPTLPLRYLQPENYLAFDNTDPFRLFDESTGEVLTEGYGRCFDPPSPDPDPLGGVLVGNGLYVYFDGIIGAWLRVRDVVEACGSYGEFTPIPPARVFDSRTGQGNGGVVARLGAGSTTRIKIHGLVGVPEEGVESVALNVTVVDQRDSPFGSNYVTVWPAGYEQPTVASVNLANGQTLGNNVTVATAAGGYVDVYSNAGTADLVVDVMGYFASTIAPSGSRFEKIREYRQLDTRQTVPLGPQQSLRVTPGYQIESGNGSWERGEVTALVMNVTAIQPSVGGHFRIYPTGTAFPDASSMNFGAGTDVNRLVTVMAGDDASVEIWNAAGTVDITVDIVGVYVDQFSGRQNGRFIGVIPERVTDTRLSSPFPGDGRVLARSFLISPGYNPSINLVTNLTAVQPTGPGFLWAGKWDTPSWQIPPTPTTSSLNYGPGTTIGNQAIVEVSGLGEIAVYTPTDTHYVLDVFGFYTYN